MKYLTISRAIALIGLSHFLIGCGDTSESKSPLDPSEVHVQELFDQSEPASKEDIATAIRRDGSLAFLSFEGVWIGFDGDSEIKFLPQGQVEMIEYGVGISGFRGTYAIDDAGIVTLQLPTFDYDWPEMVVRKDATSLLLFPVKDEYGVIMGTRGGMTYSPSHGTYWPFRAIEQKEEIDFDEQPLVPDYKLILDDIPEPAEFKPALD